MIERCHHLGYRLRSLISTLIGSGFGLANAQI